MVDVRPLNPYNVGWRLGQWVLQYLD